MGSFYPVLHGDPQILTAESAGERLPSSRLSAGGRSPLPDTLLPALPDLPRCRSLPTVQTTQTASSRALPAALPPCSALLHFTAYFARKYMQCKGVFVLFSFKDFFI